MDDHNIVLCTWLSEYYGSVTYRYVGTIDILEALKLGDIDHVYGWMKKYHPSNYFVTFSFTNEDKKTESGPAKWDVWVPVEEDNVGWSARPGTEYFERLREKARGKKFLPIARPENYIDTWITACKSVPGLYSYKY